MTCPPELMDQLAAFHEDAFSWGVTCCGGDLHAAADVLQECYLKVATGRAAFAGRSSLKTWWLAVVRLTALEQLRGKQRWRRKAEAFQDWIATLGGASPDPQATDLAVPVDAVQLAAAMARLPARQSEVLHLVFQQELSLSDAAAVMGVSIGTARQHYDRAKKRLRQQLTANPGAPISDHGS
jgi:RNA polymerase sigma factor (sigma-70 family)